MAIYRFVVHGGRTTVDGKTHYPDFVRIDVPPDAAWRMVRELIDQLERGGRTTEQATQITLFGKLTEENE